MQAVSLLATTGTRGLLLPRLLSLCYYAYSAMRLTFYTVSYYISYFRYLHNKFVVSYFVLLEAMSESYYSYSYSYSYPQMYSSGYSTTEDSSEYEFDDDVEVRTIDYTKAVPSHDEVGLPHRKENWKADEVRRHWLLKSHCEYLLFPCQYPVLSFPSCVGGYLWHKRCADVVPQPHYLKEVSRCVSAALRDLCVYRPQLDQVIYCDTLLDYNKLDYSARKRAVDNTRRFLGKQKGLLMVSLEYARLERAEAIGIVWQLGLSSGGSVNRLYLWNLFRRDQYPFTKDDTPEQYRDIGAFRKRARCIVCWNYSLWLFNSLTVLAINYGYLASKKGNTLTCISSVINGTLQELQLLCLEEDLPDTRRAVVEEGGFTIPNHVWRHAVYMCPNMGVSLIICFLPRYDQVKMFLSRSMPLRHFQLMSGMNLRDLHPWFTTTTIKLLQSWYSPILYGISLHLWRQRDDLDNSLVQLFDIFPELRALEFIGQFKDIDTIRRICDRVLRNPGCVQRLWLRAEETPSADNTALRQRAQEISDKYRRSLLRRDICFDFSTYPM